MPKPHFCTLRIPQKRRDLLIVFMAYPVPIPAVVEMTIAILENISFMGRWFI
jgi:hypothetical protein